MWARFAWLGDFRFLGLGIGWIGLIGVSVEGV